MKFIHAILLATLSSIPLASIGCSSGEPIDDEDGLTQDELSANAAKLVGSYQDKGVAAKPPTFKGLVLKDDGTFFADIDSGALAAQRCIPGGRCVQELIRISGSFRAGKKTITLSPASDVDRTTYHGRYNFTLEGEKFSLTRSGAAWEGWADSLSKEPSYCSAPVDCTAQGLAQPRCPGEWLCTEQSMCKFSCGGPMCGRHADQKSCSADPQCFAETGPSHCFNGSCSKDTVFKRCVTAPKACEGHSDQTSCRADSRCFAEMGPSSCTPDGRCTRDFVFKRCVDACKAHTDEPSCSADARCQVHMVPRPCPPGMFCPQDMVFRECRTR